MTISHLVLGSEAPGIPVVGPDTVPLKEAEASLETGPSNSKPACATPPKITLAEAPILWLGKGHAIRGHDVRYRSVCRKTSAFVARTGGA